ncbi:11459_t:CDS:2 [Funneliformis mosseae]|uniref:11459_t:CDS:1 n=1 Tax=Funneliformis mosseae TaxID=27381 RepID=A0A9N8V4L9_FUNMO|nr:11459_t:CDS:2 [Funneliformis mosseae]
MILGPEVVWKQPEEQLQISSILNLQLNFEMANVYGGSTSNQNNRPHRVVALDIFRGLLMVLQSLDHARGYLVNIRGQQAHETWYQQPVFEELVPSITRLVDSFGGTGIYLSYFGFILIILNSYFYYLLAFKYPTTILFALGVNLIFGGLIILAEMKLFLFFIKFYQTADLEIAINKANLLAIGNVVQTPKSTDYEVVDFGWWRYIWLLPGYYKNLYSIYPPLNWLSFTIFGIIYGYITLERVRNEKFNRNLNLKIGIFLLTLFIAIRIPGKFGNINPDLLPSPPPGTLFDNPYLTSVLQFVNAIKYPPDLSFFTLYMGLNHLILAFFYAIPSFNSNYLIVAINNGPLLAFGQSALFFYMAHFHIYIFMSLTMFGITSESKFNIDSWQFWFWWIFGLALLWPMCVKYAKFKSNKGPDSLWRFF